MAIINGRKVVASAGTAEALGTVPNQGMIVIQALLTNTDNVAIGGSGVIANPGTETGVTLVPGQVYSIPAIAYGQAVTPPRLTTVFVDVLVNGEGVSYTVYE